MIEAFVGLSPVVQLVLVVAVAACVIYATSAFFTFLSSWSNRSAPPES